MRVEYFYELTGNRGKTLFDSLRQRDFDRMVEDQAASCKEQGGPGGDWRESFIEECLWERLSGDHLDEIARQAGIKGPNDKIKRWLKNHECMVVDERELVYEWAWNRAGADAQDGILWDHIDRNDDVETALGFGLVKYPALEDGIYVDGGEDCISSDAANRISELCRKRNEIAAGNAASECTGSDDISKEISAIETEAVERMIRVFGFYCDIHGGRADFDEPVPKSEVLTCPSCGHPVCPVCANCFNEDPKSEEDARSYLASCDDVAGMAYCGHCGDWSEGFMVRFLKLAGCPIPPEYTVGSPLPRAASFYATATVNALPDSIDILSKVKGRFDDGVSGIIKVGHETGEIWGIPERHPEGWIVTLCYPYER